jgi:predicted GTPase
LHQRSAQHPQGPRKITSIDISSEPRKIAIHNHRQIKDSVAMEIRRDHINAGAGGYGKSSLIVNVLG